MKLQLIKSPSTHEYNGVSWNFDKKIISLEFSYEISAVHSECINRVVIEKYETRKIGFYFLDGTLDFDVEIPLLDGYQFRGINKNTISKTGVSLIFFPLDSDKGNQWKDMEQYELEAKSPCLGKYLDIYR